MKKSIEKFQAEAVERAKERLISQAKDICGINTITAVMPMRPDMAKDLAFKIKAALPNHMLCVLGTHFEDRPTLTIMLSDDLVADGSLNARALVRQVARHIKGGGGGQPHFATAGGKDINGLSIAVEEILDTVKNKM